MMTPLYYLDGLGGNRHYPVALKKALAQQGIDLIYLPLPGHPDNLDSQVKTPRDLVAWFQEAVGDTGPHLVMGYSLGADLATIIAQESQLIARLILLDGGLLDRQKHLIDKEVTIARQHMTAFALSDLEAYLADQEETNPHWSKDLEAAERLALVYDEVANKYVLNLNQDQVLDLLRLRFDAGSPLLTATYQTPTLLILADSPEQDLVAKKKLLEQASQDMVSHLILPNSSHQLYLEYPDKIALASRFFLDAF